MPPNPRPSVRARGLSPLLISIAASVLPIRLGRAIGGYPPVTKLSQFAGRLTYGSSNAPLWMASMFWALTLTFALWLWPADGINIVVMSPIDRLPPEKMCSY
jgi:hypothetical protein